MTLRTANAEDRSNWIEVIETGLDIVREFASDEEDEGEGKGVSSPKKVRHQSSDSAEGSSRHPSKDSPRSLSNDKNNPSIGSEDLEVVVDGDVGVEDEEEEEEEEEYLLGRDTIVVAEEKALGISEINKARKKEELKKISEGEVVSTPTKVSVQKRANFAELVAHSKKMDFEEADWSEEEDSESEEESESEGEEGGESRESSSRKATIVQIGSLVEGGSLNSEMVMNPYLNEEVIHDDEVLGYFHISWMKCVCVYVCVCLFVCSTRNLTSGLLK